MKIKAQLPIETDEATLLHALRVISEHKLLSEQEAASETARLRKLESRSSIAAIIFWLAMIIMAALAGEDATQEWRFPLISGAVISAAIGFGFLVAGTSVPLKISSLEPLTKESRTWLRRGARLVPAINDATEHWWRNGAVIRNRDSQFLSNIIRAVSGDKHDW